MKKVAMLLGLVGLGFVGCNSNENIVWQMGAFAQGNRVIKTYCNFDKEKGFRSVMQYMTIGADNKAVLMSDDEVKEIFNSLKQTRFGGVLDKPHKSQILTIWKDDPSFCASFDMMMSFAGAQRMQGIEVERQ